MTLIVSEIKSSQVYQQMTPIKDQLIYAVRPHLIKYGTPTGTLIAQILDSFGNVEAQSAPLNLNQLPQGSPYWHGYITFMLNSAVKMNNDFRVALISGGGYAFSESNYVGWCNGYDLGKYPATYALNKGFDAPLDVEIWGYSEIKRGF